MARKNAFYDSATMVLKCWGYVESNEPGDIKISVAEDFSLKPGEWKWNGTNHVSYTKPIPQKTDKELAADDVRALDAKTATPEMIVDLLKRLV